MTADDAQLSFSFSYNTVYIPTTTTGNAHYSLPTCTSTTVEFSPVTKNYGQGYVLVPTIQNPPPKEDYINSQFISPTVPRLVDKSSKHSSATENKKTIGGLSIEECLKRYQLAMNFEVTTLRIVDWGKEYSWPFRIMKDQFGRRYVGVEWQALPKDIRENNRAVRTISKLADEYTLSSDQLEAAQKEWASQLRDKISQKNKQDRVQVVVDLSIPGEYE